MHTNLKTKTLANMGYMAIAKVMMMGLSAVTSIILARNLSSSDYGIVGFAAIFIGFLGMFSDMGMESAVIRKENLDDTELYTGFTIKLVLGALMFAFTFLLAPVGKMFFNDSAVENVIKVLSLSFLLKALFFLPNCLLTRELDYKKLFLLQVAASAFASITSITLALTGFRYWSIVMASLCETVAMALMFNLVKPVRIRLRFSRKAAAEFISVGGNLVLSGFVIYTLFNVDNFIIGSLKGAVALGYYAIAFNWGSMICSILQGVVHSVLFPTFAKIQDDRERIVKGYLKSVDYISFIGLLSNTVLLAVAPDFLILVLGGGTNKWIPAVLSFRILCVYGIFRALLEPLGNVLVALGKTDILLKSNVLVAALELALLYPAVKYFGIEGVAAVVAVTYALQYPIYLPFMKKELNLGFGEIWAVMQPAIISACFVAALVAIHTKIFPGYSFNLLIQRVFLSMAGFTVLHGLLTKWRFVSEIRSIIGGIRLQRM
jgi:lipopolysaccharide exporter